MTGFGMKSRLCPKALLKVHNKYFDGFVSHHLHLGKSNIFKDGKNIPSKTLEISRERFRCFSVIWKFITRITRKRKNVITLAKFTTSGLKKEKQRKGKWWQRAETALKKGEPRFTFFKAISSGIKCSTQTITETTNMFKKAQLSPWRVCKLKGMTKAKISKKQHSCYAVLWYQSFLLNAPNLFGGIVQIKWYSLASLLANRL